jgi:tRNA G37 N-methylase Trm5
MDHAKILLIPDVAVAQEAILKTFPKMRAIVAYETTIKGELRKPQARLLTQSAPTTTIHIENGIKYYVRRSYCSSTAVALITSNY